ncbi:MAG: trypsin-like peptidase domain-containing protein [Pyrinomonadaceae bacterium]
MLKRNLPPWLALALLLLFAHIATAQDALPELVRRVKPSVVAIVTYTADNEPLMSGSGFFMHPGQVVTNLHVIKGAHHAEVKTLDGKGKVYPVQGILDVDEEGDIAVLSINVPADRARSLEVTGTLPEDGERVFVIGNPLRLEGSISDGIVSAVREVPNLGKILQITAPISHGNSGSPVFNMKGQVVGVVTIKVTNGQNINLALASARLLSLHADEKLLSFSDLALKGKNGSQADMLAEVWYRNGLESLWLGNYDDALGYFESTVNKNPRRAEAWLQVGFCKLKQGKNDDAIRAYQKAIQLRPDSAEAHNKLGDAFFYAGRFTDAIESYKKATRLRPEMGEAYYNLGMAYLEVGNRAAAAAQSNTLKMLDRELYEKLMSEIER